MTLEFRELDSSDDTDDLTSDNEASMQEQIDDTVSDTDSDSGMEEAAGGENDPPGADNDEEEEDEIIKALKAELNRTRDHPPSITCEDFIVDISFNPAKNIIAIGTILGDVLLYEYNNEETKLINTLEVHTKACRDIEFDLDGLNLFSSSKDKSIMVSDVETGKLSKCFENAHEEPVYSLKCLSKNRFVTGDDGGTVKLWDMRRPEPVSSFKIGEEYIADMITNESEKYLVCAGGDGVLTSIDLRGRKIYTTSEDYDSDLTCLGLFRSETKLLAGSSKGRLYLFNWKEFGLHSDEYVGNKHSISCMVPITENIVVTSGSDGELRAAHMFPQRQLGVVGQHRLPVEMLDISHDGQFIASSSYDNDVKFWNIAYFESIDELIDVNKKQNKKKDLANKLPSSDIKNPADFFSGLL